MFRAVHVDPPVLRSGFLAVALAPLLGLCALLSAQKTEGTPESSQAVRSAAKAAESWLELIDEGQYELAWEAAGEELRSVVTVPAWERRISSLRQGIGALRDRALASTETTTSLPGGQEGSYVVVTYHSSFGVLTDAVETVIVARQEEGAWRPVGYFVRPVQEPLGGA